LPVIAAGLEACGAAHADDRHVPSPEPPQTLLLTLDGQLCHASDGALKLLMLADGGLTRGGLSQPVAALAGSLVSILLLRLGERWRQGAAALLAPPPSITHENGFGQFVASGQLLRAQRNCDAPLAQVTLTRLEPHRVALERALRNLPITDGQRAVCRELLRGLPQAEVAQALGVAPATVVDHVRKVYRTLDVRSAGELRALVELRMG
jgi:DNA-binding CsgD family transcriptional regulator